MQTPTLSTKPRKILFDYLHNHAQETFNYEALTDELLSNFYDKPTYMEIVSFLIDLKWNFNIRTQMEYGDEFDNEYWWNRKHNEYLTHQEVLNLSNRQLYLNHHKFQRFIHELTY